MNAQKMLWSLMAVAAVSAGCNQVANTTNRQVDAVNAVVLADCDKYDACGQIGAGKKYASRNDCNIDARAYWNDRWTAAQCEGHISGTDLDVCTSSITAADCNGFDRALTSLTRCQASDVCKTE